MNRPYNFGAGPSMLPEEILLEAQAELLNWKGLGMSVMEIGHRSAVFSELMDQTEAELRSLLTIPDDYHVLFLAGAARQQFAMIPMNFLNQDEEAAYLVTGIWSSMAYDEAARLKRAYCVASGEQDNFTDIPDRDQWVLKDKSAYLYYVPNETVNGVRFPSVPKQPGMPLVADMTSCILSEPINIRDYSLIFAGAQKNIANAGLTLVIVHDDFLQTIDNKVLPTMLDYRTHSTTRSSYATPPTFNYYLASLMFKWIKKQGGVEALYQKNCQKAAMLYDFIDSSDFYECKVVRSNRSLVNACFRLSDPALEASFLNKARAAGLLALEGHRSVGGLRASMYNAMPVEGVIALVSFMQDFARDHS